MSDTFKRIRRTLSAQASLEGALDVMGRQKEEQILGEIREFTDRVALIIDEMVNAVRYFVADDYDALGEVAVRLERLESAADDRKLEILDRLSSGGVFSMGRADLSRLVSSMDVIANLGVGAVDRIVMRRFELPPDFNKLLVEMAKIDLEAVRKLRDAVFAMRGDFRECVGIAIEIDAIESKADKVFAEMYKAMFDMDTDFKTFHQLKAIIERLESVADKAAENGELIRHMALEYLDVG